MVSSKWKLLSQSDDGDCMIHVLSLLRDSGVCNGDELLLHSGGPITDLSQRSMVPCIDSIRILMIEPEGSDSGSIGSALEGGVSLGPPPPLSVLAQKMEEGKWKTFEEESCEDLTEALDYVSKFEITVPCETDVNFHPGGFTGILGYDLCRWSVPIRLSNTPSPGTVIGVLWRADAWIIHDRSELGIGVLALEGHPWLDIELDNLKITDVREMPSSRSVPDSESDSEHAKKVSRIREGIRKGNLYQVNYGRKWKGMMPGQPWESFLLLSRSNPAPFSCWMMVSDLGWSVASSSPERLVELDGGVVRTRPIKGTRKRGFDELEDSRLRIELVSSEKEISEHLMLVDLERHDLSSVCVPGTVNWSGWRIEALSNVQHLVSGVEGLLDERYSTSEVTSTMFPGGSVTGCPKTVTLAAIDELEGGPRGAWTGSIGHIHRGHGVADWNILIRTLEAHSGPEKWHATVQAGGGVVIGSSPAEEVEEARWKAAAVTESAWGFRTGFTENDLPEREVGIFPVPTGEGSVQSLMPGLRGGDEEVGVIGVYPCEKLDRCTLLIDNLDSFTRNIAEEIASLGHNVVIVGAETQTDNSSTPNLADEIMRHVQPERVILGPGPSVPESYPLTMELARRSIRGELVVDRSHVPLLGLCLGHQALGIADGWELIESPMGAVHGTPSLIKNDGTGVFEGLPSEIMMMRYNSLVLEPKKGSLVPNSWDATGELVMGLRHCHLPIDGVQFHPESVGSPRGRELLDKFLRKSPLAFSDQLSRQAE